MRLCLIYLLSVVLVSSGLLHAQAPAARSGPRVGYVYPAGGRQGTTFTVYVGGQFLEGVSEAQFFGDGIFAKVVDYLRPTNQKEDEEYKAEAEKLREKRRLSRPNTPQPSPETPRPVWTTEDDKRVEQLRSLLAYRMNRQTAPAICEAVVLEVTVAAEAAPGDRELRLRNINGLSNPLLFVVGQLPESTEPPAHPNTQAPEGRNPDNPRPPPPNPERMVTLPAIVNGQVLPGEVDHIRFKATQGQKLVVAVRARGLIPYLADAVPGWFQATLALQDSKGRELAYDDDFRFNPDPVLYYEIKTDGEYVVEIKDSIFRGRQDFIYRVSIGELPFITNLFPLGGPVGAKTAVEVHGWNLSASKALMDATGREPGELMLAVPRDGVLSNQVAFALDADPECTEAEPNNDLAHAQKITRPIIVNGRIEKPGDRDVFGFDGRAGEEVVVEVFARRLNSPLDSILQLLGPDGKQLAANDDSVDKGDGLNTHHADSRISLKLPVDGAYTIHLADTQHQGGPECAYRLHVRPPHPDFELRVAPSSINVRGGAHVPVTVFALRKDGFAGGIELGLRDTLRGFGLSGAHIPAGQDKVRLTLTTPATPRDEAYPVNFVGRATIDSKQVVREAIPAEDMMQAFAYRHLVPAKEMKVQVVGRGGVPKSALRLEDKTPLRLPVGGTAKFRVAVQLGKQFENIKVELSEPPEGISIQKADEGPGVMEVVFAADAAKTKIGQQGNLILIATGERVNANERKEEKGKTKKAPRATLSALPAIAYEIVGP
ncbi:MAG: PPC domain-containing protein [Nibricoccus sp.]